MRFFFISIATIFFCALALFSARAEPGATLDENLNSIAESYVKLVLALGQHDPDYVDAYYGPPEWKTEAAKEQKPLDAIHEETIDLFSKIAKLPTPDTDIVQLRLAYLAQQLGALETRVRIVQGAKLKFDEESRGLYDAVAPTKTEAHFQEVLDRLDKKIPGKGPLSERYTEWRKAFIIPKDKLDAVFQLALKTCRDRTRAHIQLPPNENFTIEYVQDKPWGAYNWYKGNYQSVIQVNTDVPAYIDRAIDLAAHEGYPGHHVYNVLLEKNLVRGRKWVEFSIYPLYSPQSLIAEGTANFGKEVVFTNAERLEFEKKVLFPAAGLDPARVDEYYSVQALTEELAYSVNEAARRFVNGEIDAQAAAAFLEKYDLLDPKRAAQRMKFIEHYRSYVINYNLGEDLVRDYVNRKGGTADQPAKRWQVFEELLSSPRLPAGLR